MDNKSARGLTIAGMTVHISPPRKPMPTKIPTRKKPLLNEKAKDKIYNALMSDPAKKKMVLDLIRDNKDKIEEYARKERIASSASAMNKVMKTFTFESPTALQKRKALEKQQKQQKLNFNNEAASSSNATSTTPKTPKKILLKGVHAYVEVTGPGGLDKSEPFKQMLISMGATISTSLHKHCTHVIYKDGTFETYKKGRRLKKYVVSILWLDAVNRTGVHVPEKNYPALGDYDSKFASDDLCDVTQ